MILSKFINKTRKVIKILSIYFGLTTTPTTKSKVLI